MTPWIRRLRTVAIPELETVQWFEQVGRPWSPLDNPGEQVFDWEQAATLSQNRLDETNLTFGGLSSYIRQHHPDRPSGPAVTSTGSLLLFGQDVIEEFNATAWSVLERIWAIGAENDWWCDAFKRCAHGDVHDYVLYRSFDDVPELKEMPDFPMRAMEIYRSGHLPCGWTMPYYKWPRGDFIYI